MSTHSLQNIGDLIGDRYEIRNYINQGGMQEVYHADDHLLQRAVALKVPKNQHATKRFRRSAVVSARVNHSNVAKTLDYVEEAGRSYLIEELINGNDLSWLLKERFEFLDPQIAAWTMHRLAKGVAASHHADVIHRDLKPSNVMVEGGQNLVGIKITDFGIAKLAEDELAEAIQGGDESITASQTAIGALPYMAPEMIDDIANVTKAVDVWSLGAMIYELLSGKKPFGSGLRAVPAIQSRDPAPITLPAAKRVQFSSAFNELYDIVLTCLQKDPTKRPTADDLVLRCEKLCYPKNARRYGNVYRFDNPNWGFIRSDEGASVFFHIESFYGEGKLKVGDRVGFASYQGGGADRAFPLVRSK